MVACSLAAPAAKPTGFVVAPAGITTYASAIPAATWPYAYSGLVTDVGAISPWGLRSAYGTHIF